MRTRAPVTSALIAVLLATVLPAMAAPRPARAASPDATVVADVTYHVVPDQRLVRVVVGGTVRNEGAEGIVAFEVDVLSGSAYRAFVDRSGAAVTVVHDDGLLTTLSITLGPQLSPGAERNFGLEFELHDRDAQDSVLLRHVASSFPAWAVGSTGASGTSVTIDVPSGYELDVLGEDLPVRERGANGGSRYRWTDIADPYVFGPYATADLAEVTLDEFIPFPSTATVGGTTISVTVRAWLDDAAWGRRVSDRITRALPVLSELIGLPYIGRHTLAVRETSSRSIGGYAGIFAGNVVRDEIHISFDASDAVTIHEAAHAWFDESISYQRWIIEGFASYYADLAIRELGLRGEQVELTPDLEDFEIPLNAWGGTELDLWTELYAYGASLEVARLIAERAGHDRLAIVWQAMADLEYAYQPGNEETSGRPESWYSQRGDTTYFLDVLEERTGQAYDDIFVEWVFAEDEASALELRTAVRRDYQRLGAVSRGWRVPAIIRRDLDAWQFVSASEHIRQARETLLRWADVTALAPPLGLEAPGSVRAAFEMGRLGEARSLAGRAADALAAIQEASDAGARRSFLDWLGSVERPLDANLASARTLYAAGDFLASSHLASGVADARLGADEAGIIRVAGLGVPLIGLFWLIRRRRSAAPASAT